MERFIAAIVVAMGLGSVAAALRLVADRVEHIAQVLAR